MSTTKLFEEAIADAKKLKEIAESNARNAIIESLSPVIKQAIEKEINGFGSMLFEEDEMAPPDSLSNSTQTVAPITPASSGKELNVPMADDNGKITIDFDDLFKKGESDKQNLPLVSSSPAVDTSSIPVSPIATPDVETLPPSMPVAEIPAPEAEIPASTNDQEQPLTEFEQAAITYESISLKVGALKNKIQGMTSFTEVSKAFLKEQLLNVYGDLSKLSGLSLVPQKIISLNENCLEELYKKIKDSKVVTNYNRTNSIKEGKVDMAGLKKMTKNLMEETEVEKDLRTVAKQRVKGSPVNDEQDTAADKASKHAISVSKKQVDNSKNDAPKLAAGVTEKFWNEEIERLERELAEAMKDEDEKELGDTDMPSASGADDKADPEDVVTEDDDTIYEVDEKDLAEAVRSIRKQTIKRQVQALKEEYTELNECDDDASMMDQGIAVGQSKPGLEEEDEMLHDDGMEDDKTVVVTISQKGGMEVSGQEEPELSHDEDSDDMDFDLDSLDLDSDEEDSDETEVKPALHLPSVSRGAAMSESKKVAKSQQTSKVVVESKDVTKLKGQLVEQSLLTAKLVYLNKFLQRDNLSKKQKQKIVEYLDNANTLDEAKEIYGKIKKVLDESVSPRASLGSSSKTTTKSGLATEEETESSDPSTITESRWAQLAGIKAKRSQ